MLTRRLLHRIVLNINLVASLSVALVAALLALVDKHLVGSRSSAYDVWPLNKVLSSLVQLGRTC